MTMQSKKTEHTTIKSFRLEDSTISFLEQAARIRKISPNAIVKELIEKDLRKGNALRGLNTVVSTSYTMKLLTEGLSPDEKSSKLRRRSQTTC